MSSKQTYLDSLETGQIVAFMNKTKMMSAKVISVDREANAVQVETKNGSRYTIPLENISWVRTGERWPKGIYNALKANSTSRKEENSNGESDSISNT